MENNFILLKNFPNEWEAKLAQELLDKHGVKTMLQKGNLAAATEFTGGTGDRDLFVLEKDIEMAKDILNIKDLDVKNKKSFIVSNFKKIQKIINILGEIIGIIILLSLWLSVEWANYEFPFFSLENSKVFLSVAVVVLVSYLIYRVYKKWPYKK